MDKFPVRLRIPHNLKKYFDWKTVIFHKRIVIDSLKDRYYSIYQNKRKKTANLEDLNGLDIYVYQTGEQWEIQNTDNRYEKILN